MSITIGVDPGKTGALALLDSYGVLVDVYDMPVADGRVSTALLRDLEAWDEDTFGAVVIEDVHAMPGQGVTSMFSFGRSLGAIEGFFAGRGKRTVYVAPHRWKKDLAVGKDKDAARGRAIELWPTKAQLFARKKDNGRAEAALIAHWHQQFGEVR